MKDFQHELESAGWNFWTPDEKLSPEFKKESINDELVLSITSKGNANTYGKWFCNVPDIRGGMQYKFSVEYCPKNIRSEIVSIVAILSWSNAKGEWLTRDYADNAAISEDSWRVLSRDFIAPEEATAVKVELTFRWAEKGSVAWRRPSLSEGKAAAPRKVKVAATLIPEGHGDKKENLGRMLEALDKAGEEKADIVCFSETVYTLGVTAPFSETGEAVPGILTNALGEKAKSYNCYVIADLYEREGDFLYNTAVLIDRKGDIIGKYRKTHLPLFEAEAGVTPGNDYPVFDTDFGKIGIMICYDHYFPEAARILRMKGAEILFVPTLGNTPVQGVARAVDNGMYVVVAGTYGEIPSRIINPIGEILGEITREKPGVCIAEIDLNRQYYTHWMSVGACGGETRSLFIKERRPDTYEEFVKG